jgi:hypothetical protein
MDSYGHRLRSTAHPQRNARDFEMPFQISPTLSGLIGLEARNRYGAALFEKQKLVHETEGPPLGSLREILSDLFRLRCKNIFHAHRNSPSQKKAAKCPAGDKTIETLP